MTADIKQIWQAGRVRRWHMNASLSDTNDYNDGHSARVARLLLVLWPDTSAALLRAALTHDDKEIFIGDISGPVKDAHPVAYAAIEQAGRQSVLDMWGIDAPFSDDLSLAECHRLKFCDRLDAFMWVKHHRPHVLDGDGWPEALDWLREIAEQFGIGEQLKGVL